MEVPSDLKTIQHPKWLKLELIALEAEPQLEPQEKTSISLDEFIATRPKWPTDRPPITLDEMDQTIAQEALKSTGV